MALPATGPLLGLDWGEVRTGVALSDEMRILASPLTTLTQRKGKRFPAGDLMELVERHAPTGVVLGLPLGLDGEDTASTRAVRELAVTLAKILPVPLVLWDERLTTARAMRAIREQGGSTRGRKEEVDALAAAVLLQHFIESTRETR